MGADIKNDGRPQDQQNEPALGYDYGVGEHHKPKEDRRTFPERCGPKMHIGEKQHEREKIQILEHRDFNRDFFPKKKICEHEPQISEPGKGKHEHIVGEPDLVKGIGHEIDKKGICAEKVEPGAGMYLQLPVIVYRVGGVVVSVPCVDPVEHQMVQIKHVHFFHGKKRMPLFKEIKDGLVEAKKQ
jgi:hypothetical protein